MSTTNSTLAAMLEQYANNNKPKPQNTSTAYNEKNYFNTMLPEGVQTATKTIRILPTSDNSTPLVEIYGHQATVEGKKKTFICLKETEGTDCPFCEARQALLATNLEANKELAKKYSARKMYVVKVIDRDDEGHGPKFWRFNHDYSKKGIFDKIFSVISTLKKDITDSKTGRDLSLTIGRDQNGYAIVQNIIPLDPEPLHADEKVAASWLADTKTWKSVYGVKPYEFLEIVVKGGVPFYDKDNQKWIDKAAVAEGNNEKEKLDSELSMGVNNVKTTVTAAAPVSTPAAPATTTVDEEDDLPF